MVLSQKQLKKEKLKELIWYVTKNYNQELYETKLWKLLFFCDADYYEKYNEKLTGIDYIKNKQGPTPFFDIASSALDELISSQVLAKGENGTFVAIEDYEIQHLGFKELDAIKSTCEKYYKLNTRQVCTLAHRDPIYLSANKFNDKLDFSFVVYRDDGSSQDESVEPSQKIEFSEKAKRGLLQALSV